MERRTGAQRKADTLALLSARKADAWVASASADGVAHLVPLSFAWDGRRIILATRASSPTARNIAAGRRARVAVGHTRDVAMVDADLEAVAAVAADTTVAEAYSSQTDWDPRQSDGDLVFITLVPGIVRPGEKKTSLTVDGSCAEAPGSTDR